MMVYKIFTVLLAGSLLLGCHTLSRCDGNNKYPINQLATQKPCHQPDCKSLLMYPSKENYHG